MPRQQRGGKRRREAAGGSSSGGGDGLGTGGDIQLRCRDCSADFAFTTRAQMLHAEKGFTAHPTRCPACRKAKRERNEAKDGNASGRPAGGGAGITYEERRVLGKNRKERRAEMRQGMEEEETSRPSFRKNMDPQEARLLRLAREGKMRRAMHRPDERVDFSAYHNRLERGGGGEGRAAVGAGERRGRGSDGSGNGERRGRGSDGSGNGERRGRGSDGSGKPLKAQIRDLERLLKRGSLPPAQQARKQAQVEQLKVALAAKTQADREKKLADKYKMVKFFEQQKLLRRLKSLTKKIDKEDGDATELRTQRARVEADLRYVRHYPRDKKYISLFPVGGADDYTCKMQAQMRAEIEASIAAERQGTATRANEQSTGGAAVAASSDDDEDDEDDDSGDDDAVDVPEDDEFFAKPAHTVDGGAGKHSAKAKEKEGGQQSSDDESDESSDDESDESSDDDDDESDGDSDDDDASE